MNEEMNTPVGASVATATETQNEATAATNPTLRSTLYRHPREKMVGGVCGGLADYLGWDPILVRVLWVVATITTGGGGFLAYLALWALLPVGTAHTGQVQPAAIELNERNLGLGAKVLIGLGALWLLANLGILPSLWVGLWAVMHIFFWPALLIGIGYVLLRGASGVGEWKMDWRGWQGRVQSGVKLPEGSEVKSSLRDLRQQMPIKRSRHDKLVMGVCGGLAQKFGIDSNLVRLVWVALSIGSVGMGVLAYVLVGLLLPEEGSAPLANQEMDVQQVQVIDGSATYKV
jgi:phage shock protein PspC (stress-responsive transcriptional regulator)